MWNCPEHIKNTLGAVIRDMTRYPEDFCHCPEKDFTRNRKPPLEKVLTLLVKVGEHSLRDKIFCCPILQTFPSSFLLSKTLYSWDLP